MTELSPGSGYEHLAESVDDMAAVFNLADVQTQVNPGAGWHCAPDPEEGITIGIDPSQIAKPDGKVEEEDVLFVSRHELQHARDMLDPDWRYQPDLSALSETDKLFWNTVHDITIDGRTVHDYAGYRDTAESLYDRIMGDRDIRKEPKHIQLMKGLRSQAVLDEGSKLRLDKGVQEIIDSLRDHEGHDLTEILMHKGTTLQQRIELAEKFIKPHYEKLADEERQNNSEQDMEQQARDANRQGDMTQSDGGSGSSEGQDGQSSETFEEQLERAAKEYKASEEEAQNSAQEGDDESGGEDEDGEQQGEDGGGEDDSGQGSLSGFVRKILDSLSGDDEAKTKERNPGDSIDAMEEAVGQLGGTVQSELHLSRGDALEYARALIINRRLIYEAAEIFTHLARIDEVQSRMIHNRQALPEGERLHTGRLPQAFIQGLSGIPMDIWRGRERKAPRTVRRFNGLDVQLLIDASKSMNGSPALHAAQMSLVLVEGLLLARQQQTKEAQGKQPDVRLGSMIFAGDTEVVMPLSHSPTGPERADMFLNTKRANQWDTLVCPGLQAIAENARQNPERDVIGIVISDNEFGDEPAGLVRRMPEKCLIWNFSLGGGDALGVGNYAAAIRQTSQLPKSLLAILRHYEGQFDGA